MVHVMENPSWLELIMCYYRQSPVSPVITDTTLLKHVDRSSFFNEESNGIMYNYDILKLN